MNDCVPCVSGGEKRVEVRPSTPRLIGEFLAVDVGQIVIAPALALVRTERWATGGGAGGHSRGPAWVGDTNGNSV